jgi:hypothetical protein
MGIREEVFFEKDLCERCLYEVGKERWVTDHIWCKTHYEMWLLEWCDDDGREYIGDEKEYAKLEARL